jgi:DNA invertase Pin-like site-specific DNA recombinase
MRVVGYARISKARNGSLSLDAQTAALAEECGRRGWQLLRVERDERSGGSRRRRAGLARAVAACKAGDAEAIMSVRLDRLSRSTQDFADLLGEADDYGFALVVLDFQIDTTRAAGRFTAGILAQVAQFERELVSERTKEALADKRAKGWQPGKLGHEDRAGIVRLYVKEGRSIADIARTLSDDLGRTVHRTSVANVLRTELLNGRKGHLQPPARAKPSTGP